MSGKILTLSLLFLVLSPVPSLQASHGARLVTSACRMAVHTREVLTPSWEKWGKWKLILVEGNALGAP